MMVLKITLFQVQRTESHLNIKRSMSPINSLSISKSCGRLLLIPANKSISSILRILVANKLTGMNRIASETLANQPGMVQVDIIDIMLVRPSHSVVPTALDASGHHISGFLPLLDRIHGVGEVLTLPHIRSLIVLLRILPISTEV